MPSDWNILKAQGFKHKESDNLTSHETPNFLLSPIISLRFWVSLKLVFGVNI